MASSAVELGELTLVIRLQDCLRRLERVRREEHASQNCDDGGAPFAGEPTISTDGGDQRRIGRFEIEERLSGGGQGIVFAAYDPVLKRRVALKLPRPETLVRGELRQRFLREAQAAARFNHPNLVQVFEAVEAGLLCFIVSAFCEGPNLRQFLERHAGLLPLDQAAQTVATLADGVDHIHRRGVLHRDIKPSNVMLEPLPSADPSRCPNGDELADFTPMLTDFGLAKLVETQGEQTRSGALLGTTAYMSPEQAKCDQAAIGPASDVYGLGAVLYELLTGRPPFCAASDGETLRMVVADDPAPPRRSQPRIPADLEAICLRCLEKSPTKRYASAALLARDLRNFLAGEPTVARPLSPRGRLVRWARRQPIVASLSAGVLLLLLTVATVSTVAAVRIHRSRREAEAIAERESKAKDEANRLRSQSVRDLNEIERRGRQMWRNVYVSNIRAAFEAQAAGDLGAVRKFLDDSRPGPEREDLRSFEWYYLWRELTTVGRTELATEGGPCYFVTYSPDGKLMAAGTEGGFVHIWNAVSLAPVHRWRAHSSCVNEIRFSPDGRLLATTSCDRTARLWHTVDWQAASEPMRRNQPLSCSAFTPDGKLLITSAGHEQAAWPAFAGNHGLGRGNRCGAAQLCRRSRHDLTAGGNAWGTPGRYHQRL